MSGTYYSKRCGPVSILRELPNRRYEIRFFNTGTVCVAREDAIKRGEIRDPFALLNCGVACTGNIKTKGKYSPYYNVWNSMIHRCYAEQDAKYKAYKDVTVCDRWLVFENFYRDCKQVDGFDETQFLAGGLVLDKDVKQRRLQSKVYSPETCTWLTREENSRYQDGQMRQFEAISPSGEVFVSDNITDFARRHNLERRHISGVLHRRARMTKGWRFRFCEEIV